jgi:hypothetical protein
MKAPRYSLQLVVLALLPLGLAGQSAPTPAVPASATPPPAAEVVPARPTTSGGIPAAGSNTRTVVSGEVRASLRDAVPRFDTPAPAATAAAPAATAAPTGPNNDIVRLPALNVTEEKPPVFKEEQLVSRADLRRMALRRYSGLNLTPFAFINNLNARIAMQMWEEDERLLRMRNVAEDVEAFARVGDQETSNYIRKSSNATFLRAPDFGMLKKQ